LRADGRDRFRQAVHAAARGGPNHKITPKPKERPASKGRLHKGKTREIYRNITLKSGAVVNVVSSTKLRLA
jgi:hypothetical protein